MWDQNYLRGTEIFKKMFGRFVENLGPGPNFKFRLGTKISLTHVDINDMVYYLIMMVYNYGLLIVNYIVTKILK